MGYRIHGEFWRVQYEVLHDLRFGCGMYGHRDAMCPLKMDKEQREGKDQGQQSDGGAQ